MAAAQTHSCNIQQRPIRCLRLFIRSLLSPVCSTGNSCWFVILWNMVVLTDELTGEMFTDSLCCHFPGCTCSASGQERIQWRFDSCWWVKQTLCWVNISRKDEKTLPEQTDWPLTCNTPEQVRQVQRTDLTHCYTSVYSLLIESGSTVVMAHNFILSGNKVENKYILHKKSGDKVMTSYLWRSNPCAPIGQILCWCGRSLTALRRRRAQVLAPPTGSGGRSFWADWDAVDSCRSRWAKLYNYTYEPINSFIDQMLDKFCRFSVTYTSRESTINLHKFSEKPEKKRKKSPENHHVFFSISVIQFVHHVTANSSC